MVIGPYTVRRTADIKAEQAEREKAKAVSAKLVQLLMDTHRQDQAIIRRWGLSKGLIAQRGGNGRMIVKEAPLSPPRGRP